MFGLISHVPIRYVFFSPVLKLRVTYQLYLPIGMLTIIGDTDIVPVVGDDITIPLLGREFKYNTCGLATEYLTAISTKASVKSIADPFLEKVTEPNPFHVSPEVCGGMLYVIPIFISKKLN
jgi:hypothetical protein